MKQLLIACLASLCFACNTTPPPPDVSHINLTVNVKRFDSAFFNTDSTHFVAQIASLQASYPHFVNDYYNNILALPPVADTANKMALRFRQLYTPVYKAAQEVWPQVVPEIARLQLAFKYAKYYFPNYQPPANIITFVGPLEGFSTVITSDGLAIGLQAYLGSQFAGYQTDFLNEIYPAYIRRRFEPSYIAINGVKALLDDIAPYNPAGKSLVVQMIEQGKRLYIAQQLLPSISDTLLTGYTSAQMEGCYANEAMIWNTLLQTNLLYEKDPELLREFVTDGPKTTILGEASPGNIAQFCGWQIVKKWMQANEKTTLAQLLQKDALALFQEAKYKPR
ncbi:MAG: hypothetical protein ACK4HE_04885 [Chitinophagaceae bacterium]